MSPLETLLLAGRLYGLHTSDCERRARTLLTRLGLSSMLRRRILTLSGGMRRRVELARALLHAPPLLLLDEPTTGVDPDESRAFWEAAAGERGGNTVIVATNDLAEAEKVCDRVAFLRAGRVIAEGTPAQLKSGLGNETVRLESSAIGESDLASIASLPGIRSLTRQGAELRLTTECATDVMRELFALSPAWIRSVHLDVTTLEDAYFARIGEPVSEGGMAA
jgi:ABC-2 type transport system ATP-binding protein